MLASEIQIPTADGFLLSATHYAPAQPNGRVVLIASAMGVKQRYYADFADFLTQTGFSVYTFDYRGMGKSVSPEMKSLRGFAVQLREWATKDAEAMVQYINKLHEGQGIVWIGHSVGGQLLGFLPSYQSITQAIFVASQCGYWGNWSGGDKAKMWLLWHVVIPPLSHLFGYFPSKRMRLFENLPKGIALEWAKWGRHRDYLFGYANEQNSHYHQIKIPILSYSFSDDTYAPRLSVQKLLEGYRSSQGEHRYLQPKDIGHRVIGHFGFFKPMYKDSLWAQALEALSATL